MFELLNRDATASVTFQSVVTTTATAWTTEGSKFDTGFAGAMLPVQERKKKLEIPSDNRIRHVPRRVHYHAQSFRLEEF
jgi:hypothetical protein